MDTNQNVHTLNPQAPPPATGGGGGGDDRRLERLEEKVSVIEQNMATIMERLNHMPTTADMHNTLGKLLLGTVSVLGFAVAVLAVLLHWLS